MREIVLSANKVALIDDADMDLLRRFSWHARYVKTPVRVLWYARAWDNSGGQRLPVHMHRLILGVTDNLILVDHKDGDGLNNQRFNLRIGTFANNAMNSRPSGCGTSRFKGVHRRSDRPKWAARIKAMGKHIYIGDYDTELEAALAYNDAAKQYFGEFAHPNNLTG